MNPMRVYSRDRIVSPLGFLLVLSILAIGTAHAAEPAPPRLRVVVETDAGGDPDDEQSLVRFLLYANEWDVEAIIANRPSARDRENLNPARTGLGIVHRLVDAYGACHANLARHDARFPSADSLRKLCVAGYDDTEEAVDRLIAIVDRPDPRPVWYSDWGTDHGAALNNLQRALDRVLRDRGPTGYAKFKDKLRLVSAEKFGDHTTKHEPPFRLLVEASRPELEGRRWYHRFSPLTAKAGGFDLKRDVLTSHGPLGALYPTNTSLPQKEGDSLYFLYLVPNGLSDPEEPTWGCWGGRHGRNENYKDKPYYWANQKDRIRGTTSRDLTLARWAVDLQNDFRARLDWCVNPKEKANHAPIAIVNDSRDRSILRRSAKPGDRMEFDASRSTDPDGDNLAFEWFVYSEAGSYRGSVELMGAGTAKATLVIPSDAVGSTIHLVLAVRDTGLPALAAYRRIVVTVER
ncbi:MAG: DUF1593 domain-containing protein [Planctomycetia bacterium]|nr:DUF1593 domain-containing protein [Planctomycetia bacterium]